MTDRLAEIAARLREVAANPSTYGTDAYLMEAAAAHLESQAEQIARLEGERDRQYDQAVEATGRALRAEQRLARLEGALKAYKDALETRPDWITIEQAQANLFAALAASPEDK